MLATPLALLDAADAPTRRQVADKMHLLGLSRSVEARVGVARPGDVVVACLQHRRFLTERTRAVYERIAGLGVPVVLAGRDLGEEDASAWPGDVRLVDLADGHPLRGSWVVVANTSAPYCFVAEELPSPEATPDARREFAWAVSGEPGAVGRVAATVLAHLLT